MCLLTHVNWLQSPDFFSFKQYHSMMAGICFALLQNLCDVSGDAIHLKDTISTSASQGSGSQAPKNMCS